MTFTRRFSSRTPVWMRSTALGSLWGMAMLKFSLGTYVPIHRASFKRNKKPVQGDLGRAQRQTVLSVSRPAA
jgi:hypothetical protein